MKNIWIVSESLPSFSRLATGAKSMDSQAHITAFLQAEESEAKEAFKYGASAVYALPVQDRTLWEQDYLMPLFEKAEVEKPEIILFSTSRRCRDVAAQLSAKLNAPCFSDVKNLSPEGGGVKGVTAVYGGLASKFSKTTAPIIIATVSPQAYEATKADDGKTGDVETLTLFLGNVKVAGRKAKEVQGSNLNEAEVVIGVGRGLAEKSDLELVKALAGKMNAAIACTRPIADFYKWLPEETYLGVSGQVVKPKLYIAVGISGQAQHYYGVRDSKVIVSINTDQEALMNQNSDYYIVGNLRDVVPALTKVL